MTCDCGEPFEPYICTECGEKYGKDIDIDKKQEWIRRTWHTGKCGICGEVKSVTHYRKWGYPKVKKDYHFRDSTKKIGEK